MDVIKKMGAARQKCCVQRYSPYGIKQCRYYATNVRDGKPYCKHHDPVAMQEKRDAMDRQFEASIKKSDADVERDSARAAVLARCREDSRYPHRLSVDMQALVETMLAAEAKAEEARKAYEEMK